MITRNIAGLFPVAAFPPIAALHSCTVSGFTSACGSNNMSAFGNGAMSGFLIDRLALPGNFTAASVIVTGLATIQSSTTSCRLQYLSMGVGVQDAACSTAGWADYSTGSWVTKQPAYYVSTATSTGDAWYDEALDKCFGVMTTGQTTSSSTGLAHVRAVGTFDLTGAQRYIRVVVAPQIETTGCGGSYTNLTGEVVFGQPSVEPFSFANQGVVYGTTAGATATST